MPKTGSHLKIISLGSAVLGVRLEGNPRKPEPDEFRVNFPGGDVSVVRCSDGTYWAHVRVDHENHGMFTTGVDKPHRIVDARLDINGIHAADVNVGDFKNPELYHLAVRIAPKTEENKND